MRARSGFLRFGLPFLRRVAHQPAPFRSLAWIAESRIVVASDERHRRSPNADRLADPVSRDRRPIPVDDLAGDGGLEVRPLPANLFERGRETSDLVAANRCVTERRRCHLRQQCMELPRNEARTASKIGLNKRLNRRFSGLEGR